MPIRKLVSQGRLEDALKMLEILVKQQNNNDLITSLTVLSSNWNRFKRDEMLGIISHEQRNLESSKITFRLLTLLEEAEIYKNSETTNAHPKEPEVKEINKNVKNIIILTANPAKTSLLNLEKEYAMIQKSVQHHKNKFAVYSDDQVTTADILKTAHRQPWCLHFSGHGRNGAPKRPNSTHKTNLEDSGLLVVSDDKRTYKLMTTKMLEVTFRTLKRNVSTLELVVLNACYSRVQAEAISKHGLYVVGVTNSIEDKICSAFSDVFYDMLAQGDAFDFKKAVDFGRASAFNASAGLVGEDEINLFYNGEKIDI